MPDLIIIRLSPQKPTDGVSFANYLVGLSITVNDMSFQNSSGAGNPIGTAFYDPSNPTSTIVQHVMSPPAPPLTPAAVATAAIVINPAKEPPAYKEYLTSDLRLVITRGAQTILDQSLNYNVAVDIGGAVPAGLDPILFAALGPVALYLSLPAPGIGLDPNSAFVSIPPDGSAPNFNQLLASVTAVLTQDPGAGSYDIAALTPAQCRHIAYEIIGNRTLNPLPVPPDPLEELYTLPDAASLESDRRRFEGDLATFYTTNNSRADALAPYVFALSAAHACENMTNNASRAGFKLPVLPGVGGTPGKATDADVILS
jgi:hypothetical protein